MEGLNALADASGGVPSRRQHTHRSVYGAAGFVMRAVALSPAGAPKILSESELEDALALSIETLSWLPLHSSGPMCYCACSHAANYAIAACTQSSC
jgi:hypothetical protein